MTTVFKLTDLPNALRVHGKKHTGRVWEKAAKMQEKWFNSPAKIMPEKIKKALDTNWPADLVFNRLLYFGLAGESQYNRCRYERD